ncbi:MAG: HIT domain-containing protein [Chloroflexota bacterium]
MSYIGGPPVPGCFLCVKAAEDRDEENLILHRTEQAIVLLNLYPYNSGHLMVAPLQHTGELTALSSEVGGELLALTQVAVGALTAEYGPEGFNIGMNLGKVAGAGLPDHLHIHVVPRWNGDTNFMPITAQTKVLPESLDQTYRRLRPRFEASS